MPFNLTLKRLNIVKEQFWKRPLKVKETYWDNQKFNLLARYPFSHILVGLNNFWIMSNFSNKKILEFRYFNNEIKESEIEIETSHILECTLLKKIWLKTLKLGPLLHILWKHFIYLACNTNNFQWFGIKCCSFIVYQTWSYLLLFVKLCL